MTCYHDRQTVDSQGPWFCKDCHKCTHGEQPDVLVQTIDEIALVASQDILDVIYGLPLIGGSPQKQARIQCIIIDAIERGKQV